MKMLYYFLGLIFIVHNLCAQHIFPWAVIGAGPAGIISVARLLDHGVQDQDIVWIDPEFAVGRMGKYYGNVPSNQKASRFIQFLDKSPLLASFDTPAVRVMRAHDPDREHPLQLAVDVCNDITHYLHGRVVWYQDTVQALHSDQDLWHLTLLDKTICARKVILATGSHPKRFQHEDIEEIPSDIALDAFKLKNYITPDDTVMVIGSAHSALLIVKYLYDMGVKRIINIYNKIPTFGMYGGLEGITAWFTKYIIQETKPANIERVLFDEHTLPYYKAVCTKIIYAFGYEPNKIIINGSTQMDYDLKTGIIQNNLYGIGIAFPQIYQKEDGTSISLIGFNSFIGRTNDLMPSWLKDGRDIEMIDSNVFDNF